MQETTRFLKLPFQFDSDKLVGDLSNLLESKWIPHFNLKGYSGDWKVISLYAKDGNESNIYAHSPSTSSVSETDTLKKSPYLKEVIDTFDFPILTARILRLGAGAEIKPHRDHELGYEDGCFRIHIPIVTSPDVHFVLDGTELVMQPGECWYTNVNYIHSVRNDGDTDRVHLVIDGERNSWSDNLFFSLAPEESFSHSAKPNDPPEVLQRTIEELRLQNRSENDDLIKELEDMLSNALPKTDEK